MSFLARNSSHLSPVYIIWGVVKKKVDQKQPMSLYDTRIIALEDGT